MGGGTPARRTVDGGVKRASGVEGAAWTSVLLLPLLTRGPRTERPTDEERMWEGRAMSLSGLVI
jgi:hypothetical protein